MDNFNSIELQCCPLCQGTGLIETENDWCVYVTCLDCGSHTIEVSYKNEEQKLEAAKTVASLWNVGKIVSNAIGE